MQATYIKRSTIEERVKKVIAEELDVDEESVTPNVRLVEDLGADSLSSVEIFLALEEEFDIEIPDEDAAAWTTVQSVIDYVTEHA